MSTLTTSSLFLQIFFQIGQGQKCPSSRTVFFLANSYKKVKWQPCLETCDRRVDTLLQTEKLIQIIFSFDDGETCKTQTRHFLLIIFVLFLELFYLTSHFRLRHTFSVTPSLIGCTLSTWR